MSERLSNEATVDTALQALRGLGVATGEVFMREAQSGSIEIKDGVIDSVIARGERGVGIRVLDERRIGFSYTSDLSADGIRACTDIARRMSFVTEPDDALALATRPLEDVDLDIYQAGVVDRRLDERGAVALAVEVAARGTDPRVTQFRKTTYSDSESTTMIATTTGVRGAYRETYCGVMTSAVATEGSERQIGYHGEAARRFAELDPQRVGERRARRGRARGRGRGTRDRSTRDAIPQDDVQRFRVDDDDRDDHRRAWRVSRDLLRRDDVRGRDRGLRAADRISRRGRTAVRGARSAAGRRARGAARGRKARVEAARDAEDGR
ncbi:MAG: hypothetical protein E6I64_00700, partial [Chloroflexi bacterium]